MAQVSIRSYKSTSAIKVGDNTNPALPKNRDIGQVTRADQLLVGGGRVEFYNANRVYRGVANVQSRGLVKMNIDFSDMLAINSATLRLWTWSVGSDLESHGIVTPQQYSNNGFSIGQQNSDWSMWGAYYWDLTGGSVGNNVWRENRNGQADQWNLTGASTSTQYGHGVHGNGYQNDFDVTNIVRNWFNGSPNYGFLLWSTVTESDFDIAKNRACAFWAQDGNSVYVPQLVIDYDPNNAPGTPQSLNPSGEEIVNTTTPWMTFSQNDSDAGERITGSSIQVVRDDGQAFDSSNSSQWYYNTYSHAWSSNNAGFTYGTLSASTYKPLVPGEDYKWRVRTADQLGEWSGWSGEAHFAVNAPPNQPTVSVSPSDLDDMLDQTPNYSFSFSDPNSTDTTMYGYRVLVEEQSSSGTWSTYWDTGDVDISGSPSTQKTITSISLNWGMDYRVRARVQDQNGAWSSYSTYVYFQTHKTAEPTALSPNATTTGYYPTFYGQRYQAPDIISKYRIIVLSTDATPATMWDSGELTTGINYGTSFSVAYNGSPLSSGELYTWKAQIYSNVGGWSDYSGQRSFTVFDASVPTINRPVGDNSHSITPEIGIRRTAVFNAIQVQVYSAQYAENAPEITDAGSSAVWNSGTLTSNITNEGTFYEWAQTYSGGTALKYVSTFSPSDSDYWDGRYNIRARVSSDSGSNWTNWSGLSFFQTDSAEVPTPHSVGEVGDMKSDSYAWIDTTTPYFRATTPSDGISKLRVLIYDANNPTQAVWSSGYVTPTTGAGTSDVTLLFDSTWYLGAGNLNLPRSRKYQWSVSIEKSNLARSGESTIKAFRVNGPPYIPTELYPENGAVIDSTDETTQLFQAYFDDPDKLEMGDYPTSWYIEVQEIGPNGNEDPTVFDTEQITGSLTAGLNSRNWPGTPFSDNIFYQYRAWFVDSLGAVGGMSGWKRFIRTTPPNGTISTPSNGGVVQSVTPAIQWTYLDGGTNDTQARFDIQIYRTDEEGNYINSVTRIGPVWSGAVYYEIPAGLLKNYEYYTFTLYVYNTVGLVDPSPSSVNVRVLLDAPYAITNLDAIAARDGSKISLTWDKTSLKAGHTFVGYRIYRKRTYEVDYTELVTLNNISTLSYDDYYAGNDVLYDYRIVGVTYAAGVGIQMESPDDSEITNKKQSGNNASEWVLVGSDRSTGHTYTVAVVDENHTKPIQQETFETLGSDRKVIMRGFVLGYEGSFTAIWRNRLTEYPADPQLQVNETQIGRDLVDYITENPGPHILKTPFGEVWDVEFTQPEYSWQPAGHLEVTLDYVETGVNRS